MSRSSDKKPELTPAQRTVLQAQTISPDGPGTIARDFETLLRFIAECELPVSGTHQLLSMKLVPALNEQMAHPLDVRLQRPQLKSFPHLNGLYLLLRGIGLSRFETVGKQRLLRLDEEALAAWRQLNPTEQYFNLLETWLMRVSEEIIGERDPFTPLFKCLSFLRRLPPAGTAIAGTQEEQSIRYYPALYNLALLEEFGLMEITHGPATPGGGWRIERVALTPWGQAVFALLEQTDPLYNEIAPARDLLAPFLGLASLFSDGAKDEPETEMQAQDATADEVGLQEPPLGLWQPLFQPFFPEWQQNLALSERTMPEGVAVFKVALGRVWRRIAIPTRLTLDDLSHSIQRAFKFDDDHLYLFAYQNRFGTKVEVNHPFLEQPPFTSEVAVGQLPLRPGDSLLYVFDFGDHWEFSLLLEAIQPPDARMKKPRVLESHGEAPPQYANWEEMD